MSENQVIELEDIWDETVEGLENQVNDLTEVNEKKEGDIKDLKKKLEDMQDVEKQRKEAEVTGLINEIKQIDENFDDTKFLEGVEDLDTKQSILTRYLETVKRLSPAIQLAGVSAAPEGEEKIKQLAVSMGLDSLLEEEGE